MPETKQQQGGRRLVSNSDSCRIQRPRKRRTLAPAQLFGLWAADAQLNSQKLLCRIQVLVVVIVNAGFAERFRERASPDFVRVTGEAGSGDPASPDFVKG